MIHEPLCEQMPINMNTIYKYSSPLYERFNSPLTIKDKGYSRMSKSGERPVILFATLAEFTWNRKVLTLDSENK